LVPDRNDDTRGALSRGVRVMHERLAIGLTLQRVSDELDVGPDLLRNLGEAGGGRPAARVRRRSFPGGDDGARFCRWRRLPAPWSEPPERSCGGCAARMSASDRSAIS